MDLLPTFCSLAGVGIPENRVLDGHDLSSLLTGESTESPRQDVFYWRSEQLYAVRSGPWKAHFITEGCYGIGPKKMVHKSPELYQVEQDPSEKYNVADQHPDVVKRLIELAEKHKASVEPVENQLTR